MSIELFQTNAALWTQCADRLQEMYGLDRSIASDFPSLFLPIEAEMLATLVPEPSLEFKWQHVEPLLEQAAQLLDRGVEERTSWDEYRIRGFLLSLELEEYYKLHRIHEAEIVAGVYEVELKQATARKRAVEDALIQQETVLTETENKADLFGAAQVTEQIQFRAERAKRTVVPYGQDNLSERKFGNPATLKSDWALNDETRAATRDLKIDAIAATVDKARSAADVGSSAENLIGLQALEAWEQQNRDFRLQRTLATKDVMDLKMRAASAEGGLLNFREKMLPLRHRFTVDYLQALERLKAASLGLERIYGYPSPWTSANVPTLDECLDWAREAINWLVKFRLVEQDVSISISLRTVLGDVGWTALLTNGQSKFLISEATFPHCLSVRLRGIAGALPKGATDCWSAIVRIPEQGVYRRSAGSAYSYDQTGLPAALLGRILTREDLDTPDVVAETALHNASPIGQWNIALPSMSAWGKARASLEDMFLDIRVSMVVMS